MIYKVELQCMQCSKTQELLSTNPMTAKDVIYGTSWVLIKDQGEWEFCSNACLKAWTASL